MADIFVYTSSTSSNLQVRGGIFLMSLDFLFIQDTERSQLLISGLGFKDRMKVVFLDMEENKDLRQKVWDISGKRGIYPLIFVGDRFVGTGEEISDLNEDGELKTMLQ